MVESVPENNSSYRQIGEGPYFIPSPNLSRQLDKTFLSHPREAVALVIAHMRGQNPQVDQRISHYVQTGISRRRFLKTAAAGVSLGALGTMDIKKALADTSSPNQKLSIFSNPQPAPSTGEYFPLFADVAQKKGLLTLDETGGPLDVADTLHALLMGGSSTHIREGWANRITAGLVDELKKIAGGDNNPVYDALKEVAGYCPELAAVQCREIPPTPRNWYPDLSTRPDLGANNPNLAVSDTAILGIEVARMAYGVYFKPFDYGIKDKSADGPTPVIEQNIAYCQNQLASTPLGSLFVVESPMNWYRAAYISPDNPNRIIAQNFGKTPISLGTDQIVSIAIPLERTDAQALQKSGFPIPDNQMNERAFFNMEPEGLTYQFVKTVADFQRMYS